MKTSLSTSLTFKMCFDVIKSAKEQPVHQARDKWCRLIVNAGEQFATVCVYGSAFVGIVMNIACFRRVLLYYM